MAVYGAILKRFSFPKSRRLITNERFKAVLAHKQRLGDEILTIYLAENDCGYPRLGISVGKSCGNAVLRNRLKRLLREVFRQNQAQIPPDFDYLLMISPQLLKKISELGNKGAAKLPTFEQVQASFLALVKMIGQ